MSTRTGSPNGNAMRQRIDRLEEMVKRLVTERGKIYSSSSNAVCTPGSSEPETGPAASAAAPETHEVGVGKTVMDGIHSVYLGGNDWDVINDIKRTCSQDQDEDEIDFSCNPVSSHTVDGASLLFSQAKPIERIEILSTLPHKPEVDRLISQFFNHQTFPITVPPILHAPTFMNEYTEHWRDPSRTSFMWLGLLFSILGITMLAYHQYGEPTEYEGMAESLFQLYRIRTAQCLLSGDIAKCLPYTVETLRFNATAELNRKDDNRRGLWMMTGVVVRAAINMGYHREPSLSSGISVIQAEYRRRIWLSVTSMDDMASFLGGFPRMMSAVYSDTKEPHNLLDSELSQHTTSLPPSRPLTEETPMTYLIIKARLFRVLGRVADFHSAPTLGSYDTVLDIDQALHEIYQNFPPHMKVEPGSDNIRRLQSNGNFSNYSLMCTYHKGMCTLHRKFMAKARVTNRFMLSRNRCITSALALLEFQQGLDPSFYKMSLTRQLLRLPAMILFLELELRRNASEVDMSPDSSVLLQVLEKSCARWEELIHVYDEARRVHGLLVGMLSTFNSGSDTKPIAAEAPLPDKSLDHLGPGSQFDASDGRFLFEKDLCDMDFDWATWDSFIEESGYETGPIY
ncbi:hypothetical protein SCARD494_10544 [Seiridium cardinale]